MSGSSPSRPEARTPSPGGHAPGAATAPGRGADEAASAAGRVAAAVDADRLWRRHMELAAIGATPKGGVNRPALSPEDAEARRRLIGWARARGFTVSVDAIANLFVRAPGADAAAAPVVSGSHLDTQPAGGRFDGIYGVLAAFEVLEAAADAGVVTRRPLEAVVWTNEEGSRFQPTTMGSAVFAGRLPLERALAATDAAGVRLETALADTLARLGVEERRAFASPMAAYVEAHIEQGPVLEAAGHTIGIVTGIQGLRWFEVEVAGEEAHAGTTPLRRRRDAFVAATEMARALRTWMADRTDTLRFTIGRFEVAPNSPNTVPGRVLFTIDFRHPDPSVLEQRGARIADICRVHAGPCAVSVRETLTSPPIAFDPAVQAVLREAAARQGVSHMDIVSGATHDAKHAALLCPAGMLFVPCAGGVSHNEA